MRFRNKKVLTFTAAGVGLRGRQREGAVHVALLFGEGDADPEFGVGGREVVAEAVGAGGAGGEGFFEPALLGTCGARREIDV